MNHLIQTIIRKATVFLLLSAVVSAVVWGVHFAAGVTLSGLLLICSFLFGNVLLSSDSASGDSVSGDSVSGDSVVGAESSLERSSELDMSPALEADGVRDPSASFAPKIPLLLTLKFPIVGASALILLSYFPPLSILLGGGMLVLAISVDAMLRLMTTAGETNGI